MINTLISAILQILVFSLIPFIVYLIKTKKLSGFMAYIGLNKSNRKANLFALLLMVVLASPLLLMTYFDETMREIMTDPNSVSGAIGQMGVGWKAFATILLTAVFKTALSEEIFFRGFLAKRLIAWLGFKTGNWIHAIIFGLIHSVLFYTITSNPMFLVLIFIFPTVGAYLKVYLNEKLANGSIVPGWIAHAAGNIVSYSSVLFLY